MLNRSQQVKKAALDLFNQLDETACYGKDDYCSNDIYHPMADALLVQSAFNLRKAKCITSAREKQVVVKSFKRLLEHTLEQDDLRGWGLGFEWNDLPENEVFTITTAMVLRAASYYQEELELAQQVIEIGQSCLNHSLLNKNLAGLIKAPIYSLGINQHITNSWLYAAAALKQTEGIGCLKARLFGYIGSHTSKASLGWGYSNDNCRVDLLHQAYICQSLMDLGFYSVVENFYVCEFDIFKESTGYIDKIDVIDKKELTKNVNQYRNLRVISNNDFCIVIYPNVARTWSIGMNLSVLSQLLSVSKSISVAPKLEQSQQSLLYSSLTRANNNERNPRASAHLLIGFSDYLVTLKSSNSVC